MKNFFLKLIIVSFVISISIFAGYENPKLVEIPKKQIKYFLKKLGIIDTFFIKKNDKEKIDEKVESIKEDFFGNSFTLEIEKIKNLDRKTAGLFFDDQDNIIIFTQNGEKIYKNQISEINLPIDFTFENDGGVRSVINFNLNYYALLSRKSFGCKFASLINIKNQLEVIKTECLPDKKNVDFAGLGGGYSQIKDDLYLSIGTPTHYSEDIDNLAQNEKSLYGKILILKPSKENDSYLDFTIFSSGHRNPQGLTEIDGTLFSTEHGPQGGDELNVIKKNYNYGWPIVSLGTRYGGKSYEKDSTLYKQPIYSFMPAVAPSALNSCPDNLQKYYKEYNCLIGLTLKEMSIIIYLINSKNKVISIEKIFLDKRMRNFALNSRSKLYVNKDHFFFSSDKEGIYKAVFKDFR